MTLAIELTDVGFEVKPHFWSKTRAILKGVGLSVEVGEVMGFLGPNGAGKTTTIKAMLGLVQPQQGSVTILGDSVHRLHVRRRIGFMPERAYFPEHLTGWELVLQHALLAGLPWSDAQRAAESTLDRVGLSSAIRSKLSTYSKGMLQRVGLAQALVANPELIILDEPMAGLDPIGRRDVRTIIEELRTQGKTVFFSTHILPDLEMLCDRVTIMVDGRVRKVGPMGTLTGESLMRVDITTGACPPEVESEIRPVTTSLTRHRSGLVAVVTTTDAANGVIDLLRSRDVTILRVETHRRSLEDVFVNAAESPSGKLLDDA